MIPSWLAIGIITFAVPLTLNRFIYSKDFRWFKRLRRPDWLTFEWAIPIIWTALFVGHGLLIIPGRLIQVLYRHGYSWAFIC